MYEDEHIMISDYDLSRSFLIAMYNDSTAPFFKVPIWKYRMSFIPNYCDQKEVQLLQSKCNVGVTNLH